MNKNEWKKWVSVVGRMLLAYALIFSQGAWAAQNQGTKDKAASPQKADAQKVAAQQVNEKQPAPATTPATQSKQTQGEESESAVAEEKPSRDGSHEGIKVHGHWTIEVRNPDGTVVTHSEFENAVTSGANGLLGAILARTLFVGLWFVVLNGNICGLQSTPGSCIVAETGISQSNLPSSSTLFQTLTICTGCIVGGNSASPSLVLAGTATAQLNGSIQSVATGFGLCTTAAQAGSLCSGDNGSFSPSFTSTTLATPIAVSAGQTAQITVNITFS